MKELKVGVIHWDAALPPDTYFGHYCVTSLSPAKYRDRVPFYGEILDEDHIRFHERTDEELTRELEFAIDAGIDYFAYVWYGEEPLRELGYVFEDPSVVSGEVWELSAMRKRHAAHPLREKIKLCAILSVHPFTDRELERVALEMQQPYYQYIEGRPLAYLYGGYRTELVERLRRACQAAGTPDPYVVFFDGDAKAQPGDYSRVQGVSNYACPTEGITAYGELITDCVRRNENRLAYGLPVVPLFSAGWNPSPRIDHPVPWYPYPRTDYASTSGPRELYDGAVRWKDKLDQLPTERLLGHILVFAWNEFEEGGFLCPTLGCNGEPDTARLDAFKEAVQYWKNSERK